MNLKISIHIFASAAFLIGGLIFFWAFSKFFNEPLIFYLGLPFAVSIFLFSYMLLRPNGKLFSFKTKHQQLPKILLCALTILFMLIVLFVPACEGPIMDLLKIPPLNWLRFVASLMLTTFLPGYFLLKILDNKNSIRGCAILVLSYLLSLFITFLTGFFILLSGNSIVSFGTPTAIIVVSTLMVLY